MEQKKYLKSRVKESEKGYRKTVTEKRLREP